MSRILAPAVLACLAISPAAGAPRRAAPPTAASIEAAAGGGARDDDPSLIAKAEILLDRAHVSPGEIDGAAGDNFRGALGAFQETRGLAPSGELDAETWRALAGDASQPVLKTYTISAADEAAPFTKSIPARLEDMARLPGLSYTGALAELAEKFHMSPGLMRALNPRADFARAGTEIVVADVPDMALRPGRRAVEVAPPPTPDSGPVAQTIVIDKPGRNLRVYDRDGRFLA